MQHTMLVLDYDVSYSEHSMDHLTVYNGFLPGQGKGFDTDLVKLISDAVSIPVIASSGAGAVEHFTEVFSKTNASAALAAGIFHRKEVKTEKDNVKLISRHV